MRFEWDGQKNKTNIRKYGLDFADAWEIFTAPMLTALDDWRCETWKMWGIDMRVP